MTFNGFNQLDFETFEVDGLDERMEAIRARIQPKFKAIGQSICDDLAILSGDEMFVHIAKHARRTVNPPKDTWMAFCHNKRGYKKHPHFQIGLFDDHVFIWLAYIYELPNKSDIAQRFLNNLILFKDIPKDFLISQDHMKKEAIDLNSLNMNDIEKILIRFRDVKKCEFLIGRHISKNDSLLSDGTKFLAFAKETFEDLLPLYKLTV